MTREIYELRCNAVVPEKSPASATPPDNLTTDETELNLHLLACESGRLEQEFIRVSLVYSAIRTWVMPG